MSTFRIVRWMLSGACVGLFLLVQGWTGMREAKTQRVNLREFTRDAPEHGWVQVSGGTLVLPLALDVNVHGVVTAAFVPLLERDRKGQVQVLVRITDPKIRSLMQEWDRQPRTEAAQKAFIAKHSKELLIDGPVQGRIVQQESISPKERNEIEAGLPDLSRNWVLIDSGAQQTYGSNVTMLLGGTGFLALVGCIVVGIAVGRRPQKETSQGKMVW